MDLLIEVQSCLLKWKTISAQTLLDILIELVNEQVNGVRVRLISEIQKNNIFYSLKVSRRKSADDYVLAGSVVTDCETQQKTFN